MMTGKMHAFRYSRLRSIRRLVLARLLDPYVPPARHIEPTVLLSVDEEGTTASASLIDLAIRSIDHARMTDLSELSEFGLAQARWASIWPGEHYRLLAGLVRAISPATVLEFGTATGLSALALKACLPDSATLVTFDVVPWHEHPGTVLKPSDFGDGRLIQHVADLTEDPTKWCNQLKRANLVFLDVNHDGTSEREFLRIFNDSLRPGTIVVMDDIHLLPMLSVWREIDHPKLDMTSFGHWSGTGLIEW